MTKSKQNNEYQMFYMYNNVTSYLTSLCLRRDISRTDSVWKTHGLKERVFSLLNILLILRNSLKFHTVKQTILPNDNITLLKFDHLVFASRSGQGVYFFPQLNP